MAETDSPGPGVSVPPLESWEFHHFSWNIRIFEFFKLLKFRFFLLFVDKSTFPMKRMAETDSPGPGVSVPPLESW